MYMKSFHLLSSYIFGGEGGLFNLFLQPSKTESKRSFFDIIFFKMAQY